MRITTTTNTVINMMDEEEAWALQEQEIRRRVDKEFARMLESEMVPESEVDVYLSGLDEVILEVKGNGIILSEKAADKIKNLLTNCLFELDMARHHEDQRRQWD